MSYFARHVALAGAAILLLSGEPDAARAQQTAAPQPIDTAADPVIAIVDGSAIKRSDLLNVQRSLPAQFQQMPLETLFPLLIDRMIDAKLLALAGRRDNLGNDAEIRSRVASYEERLIQETYLTRKIGAATSDEAVRTRFQKFVTENPAEIEVSARHILVATEQKAKELVAELKKGGDFAKLAADNTIDPSGKQSGGDLGFFKKAEMVPEFSEAAFKLREGEIADAPVKSQFGWHVIKVDKIRQQAQNLEEVREQIVNEISQEIVNGEVVKLRQTAKVERFNLDGSPAR